MKRDLKTSSKTEEVEEEEAKLCGVHAAINKQQMTGNGRTQHVGLWLLLK